MIASNKGEMTRCEAVPPASFCGGGGGKAEDDEGITKTRKKIEWAGDGERPGARRTREGYRTRADGGKAIKEREG